VGKTPERYRDSSGHGKAMPERLTAPCLPLINFSSPVLRDYRHWAKIFDQAIREN
jgi:hypothetical protein